ncbi:4'-phosphopantetheinyl transferase family protein [Methylophaga sp.]|uniref:4'-phosphopantetheinyl transferase family protein n=1 Tax=Methylophaga sp. TaxID=2024840 RepID=UPI003A945442
MPNKLAEFPQLWFAKVEHASLQNEEACKSLLSISEYRRFKAIQSPSKQRQYLLSRWLIRHALSHAYHQSMAFWNIEEITGKFPVIHNLPDDAFLSLSHSHDRIMFAMSDGPIGVDIEKKIQRKNVAEMAELFMTPEELELFHQHVNRELYFYQTWCIKEAYFKSLPAHEQQNLSLQKIDSSYIRSDKNGSTIITDRLIGYVLAVHSEKKLDAINCFALNDSDQDFMNNFGPVVDNF